MPLSNFDSLVAEVSGIEGLMHVGNVAEIAGNILSVSGLAKWASIGDLVEIESRAKPDATLLGEIVAIRNLSVDVLPDGGTSGLALGDRILMIGSMPVSPDPAWLGRVIDPFGQPLDGKPIFRGKRPMEIRAGPPDPVRRKRLGERLKTGLAIFNTFLPITRGQRIGLFAGSGVGKSTLLADLARGVEADVVVLALVGERGRELREFIDDALGAEGMKRAVVVAATSDQSPMSRRRAAAVAMSIAEFFRDMGLHVLYLVDSLTRFAEAHREVATSAGEPISQDGFPASTAQTIMRLCERAGPGVEKSGDITAVFSVLVAGSDMEGPIADLVRGVLDGHVVLDRNIAERARFPAVDVLRSVSRSLPEAATDSENLQLGEARRLMNIYAEAELMVQAGLYQSGSNIGIDAAIAARPKLEAFLARRVPEQIEESFQQLSTCLPETGKA